MKKMMNNYEAPVAEMIEMQASMVLMSSVTIPEETEYEIESGGIGGGN